MFPDFFLLDNSHQVNNSDHRSVAPSMSNVWGCSDSGTTNSSHYHGVISDKTSGGVIEPVDRLYCHHTYTLPAKMKPQIFIETITNPYRTQINNINHRRFTTEKRSILGSGRHEQFAVCFSFQSRSTCDYVFHQLYIKRAKLPFSSSVYVCLLE